MTTVHLAGNAYQFYLSRVPATQRLSLVLVPMGVNQNEGMEWQRRLYELHELLDAHFYPIESEIMFKPIFPGSADMLEINIGLGNFPADRVAELIRQELMQFK
jgi:hypothetical protein